MQFYIVTGGVVRSGVFTSDTEILRTNGGTKWHQVASLPSPRTSAGVSLPNGNFMISGERWRITKPPHIFIFIFIVYVYNTFHIYYIIGGYNGNYYSEVMIYDSGKDKWTTVGKFARSRSGHTMSLVPKETANYCV